MRDRLDIHAAFGRNHEGRLAGRAVNQHRDVEFLLDIRAVFDVEAVHLLAGRAGLHGDERVAQHFLGVGLNLGNRFGEADTALGFGRQFLELALATAAGMDLALHHIKRARKLLGRFNRFSNGEGRKARRHVGAVGFQDRLALIFMDIHGFPSRG